MDFTTLCKLKNCISPKTWKKVNEALAQYAVEESLIEGDQLRLDTTAVETNIHWPTDSSLLWDTYRVLARLIEDGRDLDPAAVGNRRLQTKKAKRLYTKISRKASKHPESQEKLKPLYQRLIELTSGICQWSEEVCEALEQGCRTGRYNMLEQAEAASIAEEIAHYRQLGLWVIEQASRRVLDGEQVPNDEKLFSIFEPHTELLKRGKAARPIEFGHMIQIQQVAGKFITDYDVFEKKPVEHELIHSVLESHDVLREMDPEFRFAQRFRAGVEGTISYLKRILGLFRCLNKGWEHYVSTVGAAVFTHNVLILTRL